MWLAGCQKPDRGKPSLFDAGLSRRSDFCSIGSRFSRLPNLGLVSLIASVGAIWRCRASACVFFGAKGLRGPTNRTRPSPRPVAFTGQSHSRYLVKIAFIIGLWLFLMTLYGKRCAQPP